MVSYPPEGYVTPTFPSLHYRPVVEHDRYYAHSLFRLGDMWRFTMLWTLVAYLVVHLGAAASALWMHGSKRRAWKFLWMVPVLYVVVAGVQAMLVGSVVGLIVGAVYRAGHYPMSTWIPFLWAWINVLVLVMSSFSIQGGL